MNENVPIEKHRSEKILKFFEYKWEIDKNLAFSLGSLNSSVPQVLEEEMYAKNLYYNFMRVYRRYFDIPRHVTCDQASDKNVICDECMKLWKAREERGYPHSEQLGHLMSATTYRFLIHHDYTIMMMQVLKNLEPLKISRDEMLIQELHEVHSVLFIYKGIFKVGYKINDICYYDMQYVTG